MFIVQSLIDEDHAFKSIRTSIITWKGERLPCKIRCFMKPRKINEATIGVETFIVIEEQPLYFVKN